MKLLLVSALLISTLAFGNEFDGYIIKTNNSNFKNESLASSLLSGLKVHHTSSGSYYHLNQNTVSNQQLEQLKNSDEVEYVEKNYLYNADQSILDSKFPEQWGLQNTGVNSTTGGTSNGWQGKTGGAQGKAGEDIKAIDAWKQTKGEKEIIIAVIDTGVDYNHEDLASNMWKNEKELNGTPGVDDDGNGFVDDIYGYDFANTDSDPLDDQGHGSHCAGVIGAAHNTKGIRGVMSNVRIMALKFLTAKGSGSTMGAVQAIDYAIKMGANIMSNSWGGGAHTQTLKEAIERAHAAGVIFVAAAGNSKTDNDSKPHFPSNYEVPNVISVGAFTGAGAKADFSCYGKKTVHVFAPGKDILSTVPGNSYKKMSGTSMATPFVSGIIGLLVSHYPNITPEEAKAKVIATSTKTEALSSFSVSGGRVNAAELLK